MNKHNLKINRHHENKQTPLVWRNRKTPTQNTKKGGTPHGRTQRQIHDKNLVSVRTTGRAIRPTDRRTNRQTIKQPQRKNKHTLTEKQADKTNNINTKQRKDMHKRRDKYIKIRREEK